MLEYSYDKEILENLRDYISRLESDANCRNTIMDFFYSDKRLNPIFNKKSTELLGQGIEDVSIIIKATVDHLLDKIEELENGITNQRDIVTPIMLTDNDIRILNILLKKYHRQIYLYDLCSTIGISEEYVKEFLTKMSELGYYAYLGTIHDGWLTDDGIRLARRLNKYGK